MPKAGKSCVAAALRPREPQAGGSAGTAAPGQGREAGAARAGPGTPSQRRPLLSDMASMPFEELLELQSRVGTKMWGRLVAGTRPDGQPQRAAPTRDRGAAEKQRPLEMSSKTRVPFLRQVVPVRKKVARDPRFDDLSGDYNPEIFEKTYRFLNEYRAKEKELVSKQLKKSKPGEEQEKLKQLLHRMDHQEAVQQERQQQQEQYLALKQEQRAQAQKGHRPYFLKKSEQRQLVLAEKYKKLKRSQKLESFLSRKRRRNAGKDRRRLPLGKD